MWVLDQYGDISLNIVEDDNFGRVREWVYGAVYELRHTGQILRAGENS